MSPRSPLRLGGKTARIMNTDPDVQQALIVVAAWAGVAIPILFAVQYTYLARWWQKPFGRTVMALDALLVLERVTRVYAWLHHHSVIATAQTDWMTVCVQLAIPLVITWRMVEFERERRHQKRRELQTARLAALGCH
jgi:hypothetical protein